MVNEWSAGKSIDDVTEVIGKEIIAGLGEVHRNLHFRGCGYTARYGCLGVGIAALRHGIADRGLIGVGLQPDTSVEEELLIPFEVPIAFGAVFILAIVATTDNWILIPFATAFE